MMGMAFGLQLDIVRVNLNCVPLYIFLFSLIALLSWLDVDRRGCINYT